jgi:hypothetical protein
LILSKYSFISRLVTCVLLSKSNLLCTNIFFKYGKFFVFIRAIKSLINLKLSWLLISTKNKAHWHSYKNVSINDGFFNNCSSILTSYRLIYKELDLSDILLIIMAI